MYEIFNAFMGLMVYVVIVYVIYKMAKRKQNPEMRKRIQEHQITADVIKKLNQTVSSDGHVVKKSEDLTCESKYGHNHHDSNEPRYIVHEEPQEGYVILNGKKIRRQDLKNY